MEYEIRYVGSHVEVYTLSGSFLFSADTAREAMDLVPDGATVATGGFIGASFAEELALELENRFLETGHPRDLSLIFCAAQGDRKDKGLNHLAHDGMLKGAALDSFLKRSVDLIG